MSDRTRWSRLPFSLAGLAVILSIEKAAEMMEDVRTDAMDALETLRELARGIYAFAVTDDGSGFDPSATGYGTGLQGMADRLAGLGGLIEVRSSPSEGTTVTGRISGAGVKP